MADLIVLLSWPSHQSIQTTTVWVLGDCQRLQSFLLPNELKNPPHPLELKGDGSALGSRTPENLPKRERRTTNRLSWDLIHRSPFFYIRNYLSACFTYKREKDTRHTRAVRNSCIKSYLSS